MKFKIALRILMIVFLILPGCEKLDEESNLADVVTTKCVVEMYSDLSVSKVFFYQKSTNQNSADEFYYTGSKEFYYSEDKIIVLYRNAANKVYYSSTYFLGSKGLADSCIDSSLYDPNSVSVYKFFYSYSSDGYLLSMLKESGYTYNYTYQNNNVVSEHFFGTPTGITYEYTDFIYRINIDTFNGPFLGKLNQNLASKKTFVGAMASSTTITTYSYTFNEDGLVIKRVEKNYMPNFPTKDKYSFAVTTFDYTTIN